MKTTIIIWDWVKQINFTPETDTEKEALKLITVNDDIHTVIKKGNLYEDDSVFWLDVYECQWGFNRANQSTESVMFVLTPKDKKENE